MKQIVFKGKSLRTGKFVEGDLAYVYRRDRRGRIVSVKP